MRHPVKRGFPGFRTRESREVRVPDLLRRIREQGGRVPVESALVHREEPAERSVQAALQEKGVPAKWAAPVNRVELVALLEWGAPVPPVGRADRPVQVGLRE